MVGTIRRFGHHPTLRGCGRGHWRAGELLQRRHPGGGRGAAGGAARLTARSTRPHANVHMHGHKTRARAQQHTDTCTCTDTRRAHARNKTPTRAPNNTTPGVCENGASNKEKPSQWHDSSGQWRHSDSSVVTNHAPRAPTLTLSCLLHLVPTWCTRWAWGLQTLAAADPAHGHGG